MIPQFSGPVPGTETSTGTWLLTSQHVIKLSLTGAEYLSNVLLASHLAGVREKFFRVLELKRCVVDVTNIIDPSLGAAAPLAPAALLHNAAQHQYRAGNGTGPVLLP